jgi:hypothetical protein
MLIGNRPVRKRRIWAIMGVLVLALGAVPLAARSDSSFQCQSGPNAAVVSACGARWEAANIRAHVSASDYGGSSPACLNQTAALLEDLASKWLANNKYAEFKGQWPCGIEPSVAKSNDGALAQACPNGIWSYENKGVAGCTGVAVAAPAPVSQPASAVATPAALGAASLVEAMRMIQAAQPDFTAIRGAAFGSSGWRLSFLINGAQFCATKASELGTYVNCGFYINRDGDVAQHAYDDYAAQLGAFAASAGGRVSVEHGPTWVATIYFDPRGKRRAEIQFTTNVGTGTGLPVGEKSYQVYLWVCSVDGKCLV